MRVQTNPRVLVHRPVGPSRAAYDFQIRIVKVDDEVTALDREIGRFREDLDGRTGAEARLSEGAR